MVSTSLSYNVQLSLKSQNPMARKADCRSPGESSLGVSRGFRTSDIIWSVRLTGGVHTRGGSPLDAYVPKLRRYLTRHPTNGESASPDHAVAGGSAAPGPVNHKDVVTTWKGLSLAQAEEIICWEATFQAVIEDYVARVLEASFVDSCPHLGL